MPYDYEDLDDAQFERVVVQCAIKLFGKGVQSFAAGVDGGRDARFEGTAEQFPSSTGPWKGLTIIQAKHTNATNTHWSDASFSGAAKTSVLSEEFNRVKKLMAAGGLNNYILFANRRLGAVSHEVIKNRIIKDTGLSSGSLFLAGTEYLDVLVEHYPEILLLAKLDPFEGPLLVSSHDLAEVILAISLQISSPLVSTNAPVVDRVSLADKNVLNNMSPAFSQSLSRKYMQYTAQIDDFLASPANADHLDRYDGAVDEFQLKIIAKRAEYNSFDDVYNYLCDLLIKRDSVLAARPKLTRAMLFYMYWHCDIGSGSNVAAE